MFAKTPQPPYFAVIFTSTRTEIDDGYGEVAERMVGLAAEQPGLLGVESARGEDGLGITVSYWASEAAILAWKHHAEHTDARAKGRGQWYRQCITRVAQVQRAYGFTAPA
ncbi:antibiotic biosynthesis monooxygenase family protein [Pseudomonas sp. RIT-To-2]|uniref:antibiotic biosynthesis monooxygenase family protein n=1 Tax=Pseudomonas sp. RIT-To-2 TaxID=3462541 RepID=UPI0024131490